MNSGTITTCIGIIIVARYRTKTSVATTELDPSERVRGRAARVSSCRTVDVSATPRLLPA